MQWDTFGLALLPPILAIAVERLNPISKDKILRDARADFAKYRTKFDSHQQYGDFIQEVVASDAGASEVAGLTPSIISAVASGFAVCNELQRPFWGAIVYVTCFIALTLWIIRLLSGRTFVEIDTTQPPFKGPLSGITYAQYVSRTIYSVNAILILTALVVFVVTWPPGAENDRPLVNRLPTDLGIPLTIAVSACFLVSGLSLVLIFSGQRASLVGLGFMAAATLIPSAKLLSVEVFIATLLSDRKSIERFPPDHAITEIDFTAFGISAAFLLAGILLSLIASSKVPRGIGIALIATAPFVSGLTLLKIEKPSFSIHMIFEFLRGRKPLPLPPITLVKGGKPEGQQFTLIATLPPFASGTAKPAKALSCFLQRLAAGLTSTLSVNSITIQRTADRRELRPDTRRQYGSNWALAQQRGACVSRVMLGYSFPLEKLFVTNAGPLYTSGSIIEADLERDRSVTVFISGSGGRPAW